ncbi:hypothetical protein ACSSZE_03500 [Acidithiobacillus caldus]
MQQPLLQRHDVNATVVVVHTGEHLRTFPHGRKSVVHRQGQMVFAVRYDHNILTNKWTFATINTTYCVPYLEMSPGLSVLFPRSVDRKRVHYVTESRAGWFGGFAKDIHGTVDELKAAYEHVNGLSS